MPSSAEHLRPNLHSYLVAHSSPPDAVLRDLIAETAERFPANVVLQIGPEQGTHAQAIRDFNDHAAADQRMDVVMLPVWDGLTLARKK